jgi:hypothetical protein
VVKEDSVDTVSPWPILHISGANSDDLSPVNQLHTSLLHHSNAYTKTPIQTIATLVVFAVPKLESSDAYKTV